MKAWEAKAELSRLMQDTGKGGNEIIIHFGEPYHMYESVGRIHYDPVDEVFYIEAIETAQPTDDAASTV